MSKEKDHEAQQHSEQEEQPDGTGIGTDEVIEGDEETPITSDDQPEGDIEDDEQPEDDEVDEDDEKRETFPRSYVEKLRRENAEARTKSKRADEYAQRLHTELVRGAGKLADPTDLPYDPEHVDNPEALSAAIDELLAAKPHLAARVVRGNIGQGFRAEPAEPVSLLGMMRARA